MDSPLAWCFLAFLCMCGLCYFALILLKADEERQAAGERAWQLQEAEWRGGI